MEGRGMRKALHAIVRGRVQGVGFRYSACHKGRSLGLTGWVRNLDSGEVEVWAEGDDKALVALELWLEVGPPGARVEQVLASRREASGNFGDFGIE